MIFKRIKYISLSLLLLSCINNSKALKSYGLVENNFKANADFTGSQLNLEDFKSFKELSDYIINAPCKDITPYFKITNQNYICGIYPIIPPCDYELTTWAPRDRNTFYVTEHGFIKNEVLIKDDSLYSILKQNYFNYGVRPEFAEQSKKVLFIFNYSKNSTLELIEYQLRLITDAYDKIQPQTELRIILGFKEVPKPLPKDSFDAKHI